MVQNPLDLTQLSLRRKENITYSVLVFSVAYFPVPSATLLHILSASAC